jgi:hypothetical protein
MRFLASPGPDLLDRIRPPVRWFLVFAALLVAGLAAQRLLAGALTPSGAEAHYLGADGREPLPAVALWEELHVNAFVYGFLLLMLGSLLAVAPVAARWRGALLWTSCAAALADLGTPFAVVAAHGLGLLRVAAFCVLAGALVVSIAVSWVSLGRPPRRADA